MVLLNKVIHTPVLDLGGYPHWISKPEFCYDLWFAAHYDTLELHLVLHLPDVLTARYELDHFNKLKCLNLSQLPVEIFN